MKPYLFLAALFFCGFCFSSTLQAQTTSTVVSTSETEATLEVRVTGVGCSTDIRTIDTGIEKLNGVASCEAARRGAVTKFVVNYNPSLVSKEEIYQAIEDTPGCKNPNDRPYRVKI